MPLTFFAPLTKRRMATRSERLLWAASAPFRSRTSVAWSIAARDTGRLELMRDLELAYAASRKGADAGPGEDRHEPRGDAAGTAGAT